METDRDKPDQDKKDNPRPQGGQDREGNKGGQGQGVNKPTGGR